MTRDILRKTKKQGIITQQIYLSLVVHPKVFLGIGQNDFSMHVDLVMQMVKVFIAPCPGRKMQKIKWSGND
ncbi:hypothetical protein [Richelia intracellularis]|uniref:hypothetical protein n=1 Tax=Richelia intracellularis TaxID=1164990 RepID=UPI0005C7C95A|nr:hypothetical protein [Richelia intracellularis]HAE06295.1 hypothetical protein [Richelia sp.]